jgi:hypothetical protein
MITATTRALVRAFRDIEPNTHLSQGAIIELASLPAVILTGPLLQENLRLRRDAERISVKDHDNNVAIKEVPPRWYNTRFNVSLSATSNIDLLPLLEACSRLQQQLPLLHAEGEERVRDYAWRWNSMPSIAANLNISGVTEARGEIIIYDVEVYSDIRETVPLIREVLFETREENWTVTKED